MENIYLGSFTLAAGLAVVFISKGNRVYVRVGARTVFTGVVLVKGSIGMAIRYTGSRRLRQKPWI